MKVLVLVVAWLVVSSEGLERFHNNTISLSMRRKYPEIMEALESKTLDPDFENLLRLSMRVESEMDLRRLEEVLTKDDFGNVLTSGLDGAEMETPFKWDELTRAAFVEYHTILRLRRYLAFMPKRVGVLDGFSFMTGNNVKRGMSLGLKLVFLGAGAVLSAGADAAEAGVQAAEGAHSAHKAGHAIHEVSSEVASHSKSLADAAKASAGLLFNVATQSAIAAWSEEEKNGIIAARRSPGEHKPRGGFGDVTLSNYMEAWLNFAPHRDKTGKWNEDAIEASMKLIKDKTSCLTASMIEKAVNSGIAKGASILTTVTGIVLLLIPEPTGATKVAGGALLIGGTVAGFASWTVDAITANMVDFHRLAILTAVIIAYLRLENDWRAKGRVCDILKADTCPKDYVCLREYMYEETIDSSKILGEYDSKGHCAPVAKATDGKTVAIKDLNNVKFGHYCQLHRDCESGYCHFAIDSMESSSVWQYIQLRTAANPDSSVSDIDPQIGYILVDKGMCARPVPKDPKTQLIGDAECEDGAEAYDPISKKHTFGACVPIQLRDLSKFKDIDVDLDLDNVKEVDDHILKERTMVYGDNYLLYFKLDDTFFFRVVEGTWNYHAMTYPVGTISEEVLAGRDRRIPKIALHNSPYEVATPVSFAPLKCRKTKVSDDAQKTVSCVEWEFNKITPDSIRYGDYVAVVSQCIKEKHREAPFPPEVTDYRTFYAGNYVTLEKSTLYPGDNCKDYQVWQVVREHGLGYPLSKIESRAFERVKTGSKFLLESAAYPWSFFQSKQSSPTMDKTKKGDPQAEVYAIPADVTRGSIPYDPFLTHFSVEGVAPPKITEKEKMEMFPTMAARVKTLREIADRG